MINSMATSSLLSKCIHTRGLDRKARNKKFLQACSILWMTLSFFLLWIFALFSSDIPSYSAGAVRLSEPFMGNVLLASAGKYGDGHDLGSNAVTRFVSVSHPARPCDDEDTQLRRRDTHGVNLPAFTETATTAHAAVSKEGEAGNEEEEEEEGDEEEKQEEAPEGENTRNQGTQPVNTTSESNSDFEEDKIVGGPIEEEEENNEADKKLDKPETSAKHNDAPETAEKQKSLHTVQKTVADTTSRADVEGSQQSTGDEMPTTVKAEEATESESEEKEGGHHTDKHLKGPPSGAQHHEDGEEKGKEPHTTHEHPAQQLPRQESTTEERTITGAEEFKVQFSFKPDFLIHSGLRPKVHHREVTDSRGRKWFEIASVTKPEILKVGADESGTIYHHPAVNYS